MRNDGREDKMPERSGRGKTVLDSKIRIPETAHSLVERTDLLNELKEADSRVIVLHAGAGFGKTILMAELAKKQENPYIWYQADSSDNDPVAFLHGILYALSKISDDYLASCREIENQSMSGDPFEKAVLSLVELFSRNQQAPLYFMMDDFHEIREERIFTIMKYLIDYTPSGFNFCFTVKGEFPHFLASYILHGKAMLLEADRLRFKRNETEQLLREQMAGKADSETVDTIQKYTEGWPAGVRFACLAMRTDRGSGDIVTALTHTKIFDYIYYEIFRKLPYDLQCFLLDTSVLQFLSPTLCNVVTGRDDSGSLLEYLVGEGMFVYKFDGPKKWYRYHSVFRDFLRSRQDGKRRREILKKAAKYSLRQGETEQAVAYAMESEAYDVVAVAVEQQGISMLKQGRRATLFQWITYLEPVKETLKYPCAYMISCCYREENQDQETEDYLKMAIKGAYEAEDNEALSTYGLEFIELLDEQYGIVKAAKAAEQLDNFTSGNVRIHMKMLEYRLQLGDRIWLEEFVQKAGGKKRKLQLVMERNAVIWALELENKTEGWGNTLEEARMYRRVSLVFSEYGFYKYGWFLYLKRDLRYKDVVKEGLSLEGKSIFSQWMHLLMLLDAYKTRKEDIHILREELLLLEEKAEKQGMEYPDLLDDDEKLMTDIFLNQDSEEDRKKEIYGEMQTEPLLKVFCLGSFMVQVGDEVLVWRTKKTKELFACLFSQNGKGMDKNGLVYRLWPDATEKNGSALFNTTVSYLRKALAQADAADILQVNDRMYSLDMSRIWSDYGRLEQIAEAVRKKEFDRIEDWKELAELYRGEFLASEDYRWTLGKKEYVEQLYVRTVEQAALHEADHQDYSTAIYLLQRLLELNAASSDMLRLLLQCRIEQGDRAGARKQYEKIRKFWQEEWDQELPPDMTDFLNGDEGEEHD